MRRVIGIARHASLQPGRAVTDVASAAARKRRYRQRQRDGLRVYPVALPDRVLEIAINGGWITDEQSLDREQVARFIADIAAEWAERWQHHFSGRVPPDGQNDG